MTAGSLYIGITHHWPIPIALNVTASMPRGLWRVEPPHSTDRTPARGDIVVAYPNARARTLGCVKGTQTLLKIVAATHPDRVCLSARGVRINDTPRATQLPEHDERPALAWTGCRRLAPDELFVMGQHPRSCDSRYWGLLTTRAVIGYARPWLTIAAHARAQTRAQTRATR